MMQQFNTIVDDSYIQRILQQNLQALRLEGRRLLKPVSNVMVADWAEEHLRLPEGTSEPGAFRIRRAPHVKEILNAINNPKMRRITLTGSSQIAKTTILQAMIGYYIDVDPKYIIMVMPTEDLAKDFAEQKLDPMIDATPVLRDKVERGGGQKKGSKTLRKKFVGGALTLRGGVSPNAFRFLSAAVTIADDYDGIPLHVKEGDPEMKLTKRSTTFPDAVNITSSTPTRDGSSRIWKLWEQSNMMRYYVRCPHCQEQYYLKWENLNWDKETDAFDKVIKHHTDTVRYACDGCGVLITEGERREMLQHGEWIADKPQITEHLGFWINELSSTLSSMKKVADQIVAAGDDSAKLEVLYNTVFGLPYKPTAGKEIDAIALIDHVTDYIDLMDMKLPNGALLLTAVADVQEGTKEKPQRIEVQVDAWGKDEQRWLILKQEFVGNLQNDYNNTWGKLDALFERIYYRADGVPLRIARMGIDSGDNTQLVYDYCRNRFDDGIIAIKGANKYAAPMIPKSYSEVANGEVVLLNIGTQMIKEELFNRFEQVKAPGPKYMHFPKVFCNAEYFKQLTSEHKVTKYVGGYSYQVFEKKNRALSNEALDLCVYGFAMMKSLHPNWEALERGIDKYKAEKLQPKVENIPEQVVQRQQVPVSQRNSFINRFRG